MLLAVGLHGKAWVIQACLVEFDIKCFTIARADPNASFNEGSVGCIVVHINVLFGVQFFEWC